MKSTSAPRRIYSTRSTLAFCFAGSLYAPQGGAESTFRKGVPVTVEAETDDGGLVVKQRKPHAKVLCETWYPLGLSSESTGRLLRSSTV